MNYRALAQLLGAQGRYGDTELVHVTKREKEMLRRAGGSGTTNPITGLDEYYEMGGDGYTDISVEGGSDSFGEQEVGAGAFATGPNVGTPAPAGTFGSAFDVGTSALPDIGPDVEVGTLPATPEVKGWGLSDFASAFMNNFAKTGPSLSRDGLSAVPALATMAMVPGGGMMRAGGAFLATVADALGIPHESPTGLFAGPADSTGFGGDLLAPEQEQFYTPAAAAPTIAATTATSAAPMQYKGLEPYMRDYLRRQGIFV